MKEKEFFQRMILDRAIDDMAVMKNAAYQPKRTAAWRRTAAIAALCLVAVIGTVFLIPSARAEVLSWFGVSTPQDYLNAEPDERPDVPELNALVASPDAAEEIVTIPIDRTDSEAVNSEAAQKVSAFFYENCDVSLGDAMFDGTNIYQSVRFNGLSGLYLLEYFTGGTVTRVEVDPEALTGTYEPNSEPPVLAMGRPEGWIIYELPDGSFIKGWIEEPYNAPVEAYLNALNRKGILLAPPSAERTLTVEKEDRAFLEENGLTATAQVRVYDPAMVEPLLDEDGNLTANVYYLVDVVEVDRGDGVYYPNTELFRAKLGTITVNMRAYLDIEKRQVKPAETSVAWADESILLSNFTVVDGRDMLSRQQAEMNGVALSADTRNTTVDALGIHNVCVRIEMPASWTQEQREALIASLSFKVLINGEEGDWAAQARCFEEQSDGSVLFRSERIGGVPYSQLKTIKTVTLVPVLNVVDSVELFDNDGNSVGVLNPAVGETAWSEPGNWIGSGWYETTEFPQYAITLVVG